MVEFLLNGMGPDAGVQQELEAPGVPIIHTRIDRAEAYLALTTFATNQADEGRVDNVILEVRSAEQSGNPRLPDDRDQQQTRTGASSHPNASWRQIQPPSGMDCQGTRTPWPAKRELAANRAAAISTVRLGGEGGTLFMACGCAFICSTT